ncbi:MAG: hypothetical protein F4X64_11470 [Chloroflexi bacterium]|nr:hypothetical protein [Chloroflexota bacterium]
MFNRIRNIRKRWIIIYATVALLAVGLVSGAVLAADARSDLANYSLNDGYSYGRHGKGQPDALLLRVAEILGIERSTLESAFVSARAEQADARFASYAALLAANGTLTQEQADEATGWFSDRPSGMEWVTEGMAGVSPSEQSTVKLTNLVAAGRLTQEQAEAVASWHADRPDSLPEIGATRSRFHGDFDGGKRGFRGHR